MTISTIILSAAAKVGVPGFLLLAICTTESMLTNAFVPNDHGSPSIGACQLKKSTAEIVGFHGSEKDLMNPKTNALFAAKYLAWQLDRYDGDLCMATSAYNSGSYYESSKRPGLPKNWAYVKRVRSKMEEGYRGTLECFGKELVENE